jgi:hypothetical protein
MKRMIRYAAENGYDKIAWTPGEVQAERYDLSKQISRIRVHGDGDNLRVSAWDHSNTNVMDLRHATRESLPDIIGKEAADKVLSQPEPKGNYAFRSLEGLDLKVGGEGMKGFYDKILPATVSKLTKKFGGKVEEASVKDTGEAVQRYDGPAPTPEQMNAVELAVHARPTQQTYTSPITGARQMFLLNRVANQQPLRAVRQRMRDDDISFQRAMSLEGTQELAEIFGGHIVQDREARSTPAHALDITPELRKAAVEQGFPLFQGGERGRITLADNKAIIDLFKSADRSTLMHEAGHLWLDELARDAARVNAPAGIREDMATVLKWLGAERPDAITTEQHEKWAQGFEQYLASGEAPSRAAPLRVPEIQGLAGRDLQEHHGDRRADPARDPRGVRPHGGNARAARRARGRGGWRQRRQDAGEARPRGARSRDLLAARIHRLARRPAQRRSADRRRARLDRAAQPRGSGLRLADPPAHGTVHRGQDGRAPRADDARPGARGGDRGRLFT